MGKIHKFCEKFADIDSDGKQTADDFFLGIRTADVMLLAALLLLCAAAFLFLRIGEKAGETVVITVDGDVFGRYDLSEAQTVPIEADDGHVENTVVIENGSVHMEEADCPDRLCIRQGAISHANEAIVCLPHKIVITINGGRTGEYDGIVK